MTTMKNLIAPSIPSLLKAVKEELGFPAAADIEFDLRKFRISERTYCKLTKDYIKSGEKDSISEAFLYYVRPMNDLGDGEMVFDPGFIKNINIYVLESEEDGRHEEPRLFFSESLRDQAFEALSGFSRAQLESGEYDEHLDNIGEEGWVYRISKPKIEQ